MKRGYAGGGALHLALAGDAPVCTRSATRGGNDCSGAVCPRGGRLLVGETGEGVLPGGDHTAGVARGWGGMDGTRALWAPGGRAPPQTSGGDSHPWRQVAAGGLLSAGKGGQGPALEPDSWAGEQGPRDAGAACRGGEPVPVGARTSGSLQRGGVRGVRGCRKQQRGGAWRLRETRVGRGPAGRVGGAPRARSGRSREEGGGRASAGTRLLLP